MKHFKSAMLMLSTAVFAVVLLGACGGQEKEDTMENGAAGEEMHQDGHEGHDHGDHDGHSHDGHDHGDGTDMKPDQVSGSDAKTVKYQCPMKCEGEKTYNSNVTCPVCGMDLEKIDA